MKICSVTILYKPSDAVADYIATYAPFVDFLYIINNSNTDLQDLVTLINQKTSNTKIEFINSKENAGIATSLNVACKLAVKNGYDWILTMDQDSYFVNATFFDQARPLLPEQNIGIIAASYYGKIPFKNDYSANFNQLLIALTSGNLVNLSAWGKIHGFDEKLFIDEVDNDFCLRLKQRQLLVLGSKQIFLQHSLGLEFSIRPLFTKKSRQIGIHAPFRMYFTVRNGLYVSFKYFLESPFFSFHRWKNLVTKLLLTIFFYPDKRTYFYYYFKGVAHFISLNFKYNPLKRNQ